MTEGRDFAGEEQIPFSPKRRHFCLENWLLMASYPVSADPTYKPWKLPGTLNRQNLCFAGFEGIFRICLGYYVAFQTFPQQDLFFLLI